MHRISRRSVLRGAGVSLALPFLEALAPGASRLSPAAPPVRLAVLFHPNGVFPAKWNPTGEGRDYQLSEILEPLAAVRDDVSVLSNISTGVRGHVEATSAFLTGTPLHKKAADRINTPKVGVSLDQFVAEKIGGRTRLASIELGTEPPRSGGENGLAIAFANTVSWRSDHTKVDPEISPQAAFDRLFGVNEKTREELLDDRSLLDRVMADAKRLERNASATDKAKLDQYLTSVRDVEKRIQGSLNPQGEKLGWKPLVTPTLERPEDGLPGRDQHVKMMLDLMALALQTDQTRVATFMMAHGFSRQDFSFLEGVKGDHHTMSHHKNQEEWTAPYTKVSRWYVSNLAYLMQKMKAVDEGGSTLLDNTVIVYGSGLKDGNGHVTNDLPLLLAGRAGGRLNPGRRIVFPKDTPVENLHLTLAQTLGVETDRFNAAEHTVADL
ncbi:MAG: DUF1552 domain-containing protein [Acidobacteria bacterium]|nr:DUF1552 domain-containing protein [Acidobacteriota bacterium]